MKIFKSLQVSIDISTKILIISIEPDGFPPEPPKMHFENFINFSLNFRVNFDKMLQIFFKKSQYVL